jgi:coproporphyrinogen III oxidase-like Fe-S oxidoreductase
LIQSKAPDIHFTFEVRTEFLDEEMAELFASVSCGLQIGLQSTNITALAEINRRFDSNAYSKKIKLLNEYGVIFGLDLIFGLPKDSFSDFCKSLDYAINLQPNNLDIFQLAVLPGTVLYDYMEKENIRFMKEPPYLVQETHSFSEKDLLKANNLKKACDNSL